MRGEAATSARTGRQAPPDVARFLWLSLAAAVVTILLKSLAAGLTGSVGFLSDALESGVNLAAAAVGLWAVRLAGRPPDEGHHFGHGNAEYLSAAVEGGMVFVAAGLILWTSVRRLLHPIELERPGVGLVLTGAATAVNLVVGLALVRAGRAHRSIAVEADGTHLLTDVVTSLGVLAGIALVAVFGWRRLDPIVALVVGANVLWAGVRLVRRSVNGLLDAALAPPDADAVAAVLDRHRAEHGVEFHALRTRESGRHRFVFVHLLVPGDWTVTQGHDLAERLDVDVAAVLPGTRTFVHVEPRDDPSSYDHPDLHQPVPPLTDS